MSKPLRDVAMCELPTVLTHDASHTPVSIVSNSVLLREGLALLLAEHLDLHIVSYYSGETCVRSDLPNPPGHIVLLDGSVGREIGVTWTQYWCGLTPPARVIIMELTNSTDVILACIEAGAVGYTLEGDSATQVASVIKAAQQGLAHCSPEITARLFGRVAALHAALPPLPVLSAPLTCRELEVLQYIAAGHSNQEIAGALVIEIHTVKHHVHHILEKLKVRHRWEAARLATEQGWCVADRTTKV